MENNKENLCFHLCFVGSPPSCHPCTEACYMNWELLISKETEKVNQLSGIVTELLNSFGSMSVDGINNTLQMLKTNVTYANQIFSSGGRADLVEKRDQIERVDKNGVIVNFCRLDLNTERAGKRCRVLRELCHSFIPRVSCVVCLSQFRLGSKTPMSLTPFVWKNRGQYFLEPFSGRQNSFLDNFIPFLSYCCLV